ncbi:hypothetical protein ACTMKN_02200 [Bacteroides pyogenes]|nr:hypothetical protein [Bacteroides pyogenes]
MKRIPTTSRSLDLYHHINGDSFEKQNKEILSDYLNFRTQRIG